MANKADVPLLFNVILTLHTSIHGSNRTLVVPFAVANIKSNILGTPFFEKYVKTLSIGHMSLTIETPHESHVLFLLPHIKKRTIHIHLTFIQLKLKKYTFYAQRISSYSIPNSTYFSFNF